jgi:signal peptidase
VDRYAVVVGRLDERPASRRAGSSSSGSAAGPRSQIRRIRRTLSRALANLAFVMMFGCAGIMVVPAILGYHRYVILTGSMTGTYDQGSIVFDKPIPTSSLKVGDPITYSPPPGFTSQKRVTHRIWWIGRGPNGVRVFRTKGDHNEAPDVWKFELNQPTQDRVVFHIPYVGYLFMLLSIKIFRMILIGVPALLIGVFILRGLWREAGEEARKQKLAELGWQKVGDSGGDVELEPVPEPATVRRPVQVALGLVPRLVPVAGSEAPSRAPATPSTRSSFGRGAQLHVGRLGGARARGSQLCAAPAASAARATPAVLARS